MHFSTSILLLAFSFATSALSQDVTGSPKMQPLMKAKIASRIKCKQTGICGKHVASNDIVRKAKCENGFAGPYPCQSIDLLSHLTNDELGSREGGADDPDHDPNGEGSDVWGWTSADGREVSTILSTLSAFDDAEHCICILYYVSHLFQSVRNLSSDRWFRFCRSSSIWTDDFPWSTANSNHHVDLERRQG